MTLWLEIACHSDEHRRLTVTGRLYRLDSSEGVAAGDYPSSTRHNKTCTYTVHVRRRGALWSSAVTREVDRQGEAMSDVREQRREVIVPREGRMPDLIRGGPLLLWCPQFSTSPHCCISASLNLRPCSFAFTPPAARPLVMCSIHGHFHSLFILDTLGQASGKGITRLRGSTNLFPPSSRIR